MNSFLLTGKSALLSETHTLCTHANFISINSSSFKQINSWKEPDDKMVAIVHLGEKGIEEHQD